MQTIFIVIWVLTSIAMAVFSTRLIIRIQTKKLGLDDLFLGIGAVLLLQTYIVGTIATGWIQELKDAVARQDFTWVLENDRRIIKCWYSTSATYIFSIWFIKLGIAWFLCRMSNHILQYERCKNLLFWFIVVSFACVEIIFWVSCPPGDFVTETLASAPPKYTRCHWNVQVIAPTVFNVVADVILFLYPFPIIFMANIPRSLRYSLLFVFALCGIVTASAIIRVTLMTAGKFLQSMSELYALSWWAAIEGAISLLVASLPVIGGRMISRWRHILTRGSTHYSLRLSKSIRSKQSHVQRSVHTVHEMKSMEFESESYIGKEMKVETVISAGTGDDSPEEPVSLIQHMAKMARRGSNNDLNESGANIVTITKELYIQEEHSEDV